MSVEPTLRSRLGTVPKTVGALVLLQAALPVTLTVTAVALLRSLIHPPPSPPASPASTERSPAKTILLSGGKMTKALQLARSFHAAGHRVVLVETAKYRLTGHRFSRAVDRFHTVPAPDDPGYADALVDIVRRERVDVYVPVCSPAASRFDALAKPALSQYCEVLHGDPDVIELVDDKFEFATIADSLGLPIPATHRITTPEDVADAVTQPGAPYILKSIAYDPVHRLDLTQLPLRTRDETYAFARSKPVTESNPWIAQAFVAGTEYCAHSTVRDGHLQVWCCCESSASQLNYAMVDKPEIEDWVRKFVGDLKLTGQYSFDFIETADGPVAIECNPRTHSAITMFYDHPGLAHAYLDDGGPVIRPTPTSKPTYWLYNEVWRILSRPSTAREGLTTIRHGKDAVFDWSDPLPFLLLHHLQIPWLLVMNLLRLKDWVKIDFNIGKLVEIDGD